MESARSSAPSLGRPSALQRLRRRLWLGLLTPGWGRATDAARLRGWARLLEWHDAKSPTARRRLVVRALRTPLRAWREARAGVTEFGAEVQAAAGVSPAAQRRQLWWLRVRHGLDAVSYIDYQLYRADRRRRAAEYVQEPEHTRLVRWYNRRDANGDAAVLRDKPRFHEWCRAHGFPSVPTLLEYDEGALVASALAGDPAAALPPRDLFSKPVDATGGHGTSRWRYVVGPEGKGGWVGRDGRTRSAEELLAEVAETSLTLPLKNQRTSRRMLVQPALTNHRDLLPLTPGALNTLRILVARPPGGGARVVIAAYRLAVGDAPADNFHFGGMMAPVDLATGRLGTAVRRRERVLVPVERHPDTGAVIAGHQVPCWPEALAIAERALDAARGVPVIGWDVAITDDGPVLIEANAASNPDIAQAPTGVPLNETLLPGALDAHMRAYFEI